MRKRKRCYNIKGYITAYEGNLPAGIGQSVTYLIHPKEQSKLSLVILINTLPEV
jgi:hypothetical protein